MNSALAQKQADVSATAFRRFVHLLLEAPGEDSPCPPHVLSQIAAHASHARERQAAASGQDFIFSKAELDTLTAVWDAARQLRIMAIAHEAPGSRLYNDAGLAEDLLRGVETMAHRLYTPDRPRLGNWWHWEIGIPLFLLDAALLGDGGG